MSEDYLKDSMTKLHGIRSGEPKRPESLIEMTSMVPEVPEVSLCFNQETNQPLQLNRASTSEVAGSVVDHHQRHHRNEMFHRHKYESYNTWKAKNAQALHNITGGLERTDLGSKRASGTKRPAGLVRKQNSGNEMYSSPLIANGTIEVVNSTHQNNCSAVYSPQINAQVQVPTSNQPGNTHHYTGHQHHPTHKHHFPQYHVRSSQQTEENFKKPSIPSSNLQNHYSCKETIVENIPYRFQTSDKSNHNVNPVFCVPNYCDKVQCSCEKQNACLNGNQFVNEKPMLTDETRANVQFLDTTKLYPPLESGLINSHLNSLSHIINTQKEQISMLCQEVSSQKMIMSALLEEVRQIHAAVSPDTQINRVTPPTAKKSCQCCSCEHQNDKGFRNKTSEDSMNGQTVHNGNSSSKQPPLSPISVEKRSVGVMTSSLDKSNNSTASCSEKDKPQGVEDNVHRIKKQHQKPKPFDSPCPQKNKLTNKKEHSHREEKKKPHSNLAQRRKNKKEESNESSQSEASFSLDEGEVVVRTVDQGDASPDASIHVNMPDYSASSAESDTSDNSDSEEGGKESGTEDESSDPQIGWTFYDRVVGQVNNMLKKTSSDPRQENAHTQRRNEGNVLYQCNEDYETENNWSKRVTFDGPPLEDSDNNGLHMPRYHHFRTNQDYRMSGGPERVCDYSNSLSMVNGSTNVSFATYRYYQRHQLLPPPPPKDQVFLDPPQMKKKNKTRKSEKTPPMSQKSHKRRSGGPPSKILDMSALKHQPKLF